MAEPAAREDPLERLLEGLRLDLLDRDLFLGDPGPGSGRLFGGMVAAQSVMAASLTVDEGALHSIHAYFLRPGNHEGPIRFLVDRIRDGRSFTTRRVVAHQGGEAIFNLSASFARPEDGISHQYPMPEAPPPEQLTDWETVRPTLFGRSTPRSPQSPIEVRICDPDPGDPDQPKLPRSEVWMRARGPLPDDPRVHAAVLTYASDRALIGVAARPHGIPWPQRMVASLDHAIWMHRPPRLDDWILYATHSPAAHGARGLAIGGLYERRGVRIATVAQEGLIRVRRP